MIVSSDLRIGEATRGASRTLARIYGPPLDGFTVLAITALVGMAVRGAFMFHSALTGGLGVSGIAFPMGVLAGLIGVAYVSRTRRRGAYRAALVRRGTADPLPISIELGDDALTYRVGKLTYTAPWEAVSDLIPAGDLWVFVAQGAPLYLPRRTFPDPQSERAFMIAALDRMSPAARERSREAADLAGEGLRP